MIHLFFQRWPPGTGYQVKKHDELRFGILENVDELRIVGLLNCRRFVIRQITQT